MFAGDEIVGLTQDEAALRAQWRHWLDTEMAWLDRRAIPIWHTTGNHTTYDAMSERVFREVLALPANGPPDQAGLSYCVRRDDLLMVFVNTSWSGLGGEGHIETEWLARTLENEKSARYKLVIGHHPAFPVNGFSGSYQREIGHEYTKPFWDILVKGNVLAYLCSHILAFDVQLHQGVLQICSAGAGTAHRMPDRSEYLHCVQVAIDEDGLRYQVLDRDGTVREWLSWPPPVAAPCPWRELSCGQADGLVSGQLDEGRIIELRLSGRTAGLNLGPAQTLFSAFSPDAIAPLWLGLRGPGQTLTVIAGWDPGRSPSYWLGPNLAADRDFDIHVALCPHMGPGGVLYRCHDDPRWSSFSAATDAGLAQSAWPSQWSVGHGQAGATDRPFKGPSLRVSVRLR